MMPGTKDKGSRLYLNVQVPSVSLCSLALLKNSCNGDSSKGNLRSPGGSRGGSGGGAFCLPHTCPWPWVGISVPPTQFSLLHSVGASPSPRTPRRSCFPAAVNPQGRCWRRGSRV